MPDKLRFIHISDTHIHHDITYKGHAAHTAYDGAQMLVRTINALPFVPDFVLHTGDVAYNPDPEAYRMARDILQKIQYPVYYIAGNHDDSKALQSVLLNRPDKALLSPLAYEFEVKGVQIVCVDSNGPEEPPRGYVTVEQLEWLARICTAEDDRPLVIAVHHNMLKIGVPWLDDYMRSSNGEAFHAVVKKAAKRLRGVFFGHVHQPIDYYRDGVLYSAAPSSWFVLDLMPTPAMTYTMPDTVALPGYNIVTVTADTTFIQRCSFQVPLNS